MEFETRTQLQDFAEGRDGEIAIFECDSKFGYFLGLEHNGFITYIHPCADTEAFVFSACNFLDETLSALCEISTPRIEMLKQHCPTLITAMEDAVSDRFDRGAFIYLEQGIWIFAKKINFAFKERLEEKGIEAIVDPVMVDAINSLHDRFIQLVTELHDWDGFTGWEETKIAAQEILPGVKWGLRIGRWFS